MVHNFGPRSSLLQPLASYLRSRQLRVFRFPDAAASYARPSGVS
jgi:hypothetical protein